MALQILVIYVPPMQRAFGTTALAPIDWVRCIAAASTVLWMRELSKFFSRRRRGLAAAG
jgi:Ca2+-transporting ATPase